MIKFLGSLSAGDAHLFGSKAANLGILKQAGLNVPEGFALSIEAYDQYCEYNKIDASSDQYLACNREIQDQIMHGRIPPAIQLEIGKYLQELKKAGMYDGFAVRSSSVIEDTENHSMAGMFSSYIKLDGDEDIEEAIRKCYASLFSDKVLHWVFENNLNRKDLKMGVIIQQFVDGSPSGVVFTADTVNMDTGLMHINVVNGICADFVDGSAQSSLYIMDKRTESIREKHIPEGMPLLPDPMLQEVLQTSAKVERVFGCCQDIEWTINGNQLYILQARPITTLCTNDFTTAWSDAVDESYTWYRMMPVPCPPLMQDVMKIEVDYLAQGAYDAVFRLDTYGTAVIQNGYVYAREISIENVEEKREKFLNRLTMLQDQGKCIFHDVILPELQTLMHELDAFVGKKLSRGELEQFLKLSLEYLKQTWSNHWPAIQANEFLYKFEKIFLESFKDMQMQDFYDLIYGVSILARERELLFKMVETVKAEKVLTAMFDSFQYDEILYERLKREPKANQLLELLSVYVREYGICDSGIDSILHPVVLERPDYAIGHVRGLLHVDERIFFESMTTALDNKEKLKKSIVDRLEKDQQKQFLEMLALAEKSFLMNDNHNYYMERMYRGYLRLAVMAVGRLLCEEGRMDNPEDIQFLYLDEIFAVIRGEEVQPGLLQKRKQEYEAQKRMMAPEMLGKVPEADGMAAMYDKQEAKQPEEQCIKLKGVSGLRKKVTGKVYIGMPERLEEERILVLPHCHCGDILPLLGKVKGLVFNWGSPYDHPGIIAREMGIPAIYKTNHAMEILQSDDEIELDGFTGEVTVLRRAR